MIYELRTYTLVPGKQAEYLKLSGDVGRKARGDKYGKLEGHWFTEFGTLNQVVHLWLDAAGRLLKVEIPSRRLRVERLPPA